MRTSGSGSSTGPGCTAGRTSASAGHRRQTRGPSRSPGRAPGTEGLLTRWPAGSAAGLLAPLARMAEGGGGLPTQCRLGLRFVSPSANRHCWGHQSQTLATTPLPEGSGPRPSLWAPQQRQDSGAVPAGVPGGSGWAGRGGAHRQVPGAVGAGRVVAGEVRCAEDALCLQLALQGQVHLTGWPREQGLYRAPRPVPLTSPLPLNSTAYCDCDRDLGPQLSRLKMGTMTGHTSKGS